MPPLAPGRSRFAAFSVRRDAMNRKEQQKRARLTNIYNHLAYSLFARAAPSIADSVLLNGEDTDEWSCKGCGQSIWIRSRRKQCFLCARFFHSDCRSATVVLVKPSIEKEKQGKVVKCCMECRRNYEAVQKFDAFRQGFSVRRKVDVMFDLYKKLRGRITQAIQTFGSQVIAFVEQNYEADRAEYLVCRNVHTKLTEEFQQLTKVMKKMIDAKFVCKREELIAKNMRSCIADWISESLSQLRALEISWKKVQIKEAVVAKQSSSSALVSPAAARKPASLGARIVSISPIVVPLEGARISIFGENFAEGGSLQIFVENIACKVERVGAGQIAVWAPALGEGPKDIKLVQAGSEILLPKMVNYSAEAGGSQATTPTTPSLERGSGGSGMTTGSSIGLTRRERAVSLTTIEEETEKEVREVAREEQNEVAIVSLNPVMSPLNGTMIELTGYHLDEDCTVMIDGVCCDFVNFLTARNAETQRLVFLAPSLLEGGFKMVEVINSDGKSAKLENVLFYDSS